MRQSLKWLFVYTFDEKLRHVWFRNKIAYSSFEVFKIYLQIHYRKTNCLNNLLFSVEKTPT